MTSQEILGVPWPYEPCDLCGSAPSDKSTHWVVWREQGDTLFVWGYLFCTKKWEKMQLFPKTHGITCGWCLRRLRMGVQEALTDG